jgi:hypothetical protein
MSMTNTIIAAYQEIGNIKKTAKHLGISQEKVTKLLDAAGYPRKKLNLTASKTLCFNCANARADRCAFMGAPMEKTEAALTEMGTEYRAKTVTVGNPKYPKKVRLLTVTKCPKYQEGDIVG